MEITKKSNEYRKNNYNKNGIFAVIIIVCVPAISTIVETGGFIVTQAQEEQSPFGPVFPLPASPSPSPASPSPSPTMVSPEIKAQMCDPNNPKLEFVNSTESEVCGLPTSLKNETIITTAMPLPTPKPITPPSSAVH